MANKEIRKNGLVYGMAMGKLAVLEDWSFSSLIAFNNCLSMLMEDFKAKILALLKRMNARKEQKGWMLGK